MVLPHQQEEDQSHEDGRERERRGRGEGFSNYPWNEREESG